MLPKKRPHPSPSGPPSPAPFLVEELRKEIMAGARKEIIPARDLLGTGSTLLNLACSGRTAGGYPKGKYILLAGVSDSAKTWLALSAFGEATLRDDFDDYRLIYDAPEDGASMDRAFYFGRAVEERIEPPAGTKESPECSSTVEDFYDYVTDALDDGRPFVYVIDSESALTSRADDLLQRKNKTARRKGRKESGSYETSKPKIHSARLRGVRGRLRESGSILIVISHLRDNIGFGSRFEPNTRPGGTALKFYSDVEIWTYVRGAIRTEFRDKKRFQGNKILAKVKRSRITGKKAEAEISIYADTGIDDTGDCVNYLINEGHWPVKKGIVTANEFAFQGHAEKLIQKIEEEGKEKVLWRTVKNVWKDIELACSIRRKSRYN